MEKKYYKYKLKDLLLIDKIITIHYFEFGKNFVSKGEAHDFWELVYADKENIIITADDKKIILNEGEIFFHKPNSYHVLSANGKSAPNVIIISFESKSQAIHFFENAKFNIGKQHVKYIYSIIEESKKTFNLPVSNPDLKKMELLSRPALGGEQMIKNFLEILLIGIMRQETEKNDGNAIFLKEDELKGRITNEIIALLKENVNNNIKIDSICKKLNYNKSYIFRQFKSDTGSTIMSYYTRLKIEKAKKLLREGNLNVSQIALSLSFDTPNYFSKTFKKYTGFTPLKYQKIHGLGIKN